MIRRDILSGNKFEYDDAEATWGPEIKGYFADKGQDNEDISLTQAKTAVEFFLHHRDNKFEGPLSVLEKIIIGCR